MESMPIIVGPAAALLASTVVAGASGTTVSILGTATAGVDQAAGAFQITANLSTGAAAPGTIVFRGGQILASGATVQTAATIATLRMSPVTTGIAEFVFGQATARIVGGATNGLAIRNSANARDNWSVNDAGTFLTQTSATFSAIQILSATAGEGANGLILRGNNSSTNVNIQAGDSGTVGLKLVCTYFDGTQTRSALEFANVAAGFGALALMRSGGTVTINGAAPGAAGSVTTFMKAVSGIADNVATTVLTVTCPNAAQSAFLRVKLCASLGAGGAVGANEATAIMELIIAMTRTPGANMGRNMAFAAQTSSLVVGAATITLTPSTTAVAGAVGATNTYDLQVTIAHGSGASTNHTCLLEAILINANATGITAA